MLVFDFFFKSCRPGGVAQDLPIGFCEDLALFCQQFASRIDDMEEMLTENRIWRQRLVDIGQASILPRSFLFIVFPLLYDSHFCVWYFVSIQRDH